MNKVSIFVHIFLAPFLVLSLDIFLTLVFQAHRVWPSIDIPMHFLGGASIAYGGYVFFRILKERKALQISLPFLEFFFLIAIVVLAAVLWELFEFIGGYGFGFVFFQANLADTIADLMFGLLGGGVAGGLLIFLKKVKR